MRRTLKTVIISALGITTLIALAWIAASNGLFGDVEFGYYKGFNQAKHAIQESGCATVIEYGGVNKDIFLEEFHFKVTTKSGRIVRLWFDAKNMNIRQACFRPRGLLLIDPEHPYGQKYSLASVQEILREKDFQVNNLKDVLFHIRELEQVFRDNPGETIENPWDGQYPWEYLAIELPDEKGLQGFQYADIQTKDVTDWP